MDPFLGLLYLSERTIIFNVFIGGFVDAFIPTQCGNSFDLAILASTYLFRLPKLI